MDQENPVNSASGGGVAGTHPEIESAPVYVGPATAAQKNTIVSPLIPIACWRVDDIRFDFDSSFVLPETSAEMQALSDLRDKHTLQVPAATPGDPGSAIPPPLSLFGHADPVGTDDYNKTLSGRRVIAVYAMLTRKTALWENLYSQPFGGDRWGTRALQNMLTTVDPTLNTDQSRLQQQLSSAQSSSGTRTSLYSSYMDKVCGSLQLDPTDFLAEGADSGGKGDYQGCGEFNPVLLFSQEEDQQFQDPQFKQKRDAKNAPNRRVMGLLFRPGAIVDPTKWPCPRATEGISGCQKRFWSDGESRRSTLESGQERRFETTHDTFACRFYQRLADNSPCERVQNLIQIQLLYEDETPMANAQYKAVFGETSLTGTTDKDGKATIAPPDNASDEFSLFLVTFPESYEDPTDDSSSDSSSSTAVVDNDDGTKILWPHSVLTSLLVCFFLWGALRPALAQPADLPPVSVVLKGPLYRDVGGGNGSVELTLNLEPRRAAGKASYSGLGEFTILNGKLELLESSGAPQDFRARYRLQYETDLCEHARPVPAGTAIRKMDPCFYGEGDARPQHRIQAEALLIRERLADRDVFIAAGATDVRSLSDLFRVSGRTGR